MEYFFHLSMIRTFLFFKRYLLEIRLSSKIPFEQSQSCKIYWNGWQSLFGVDGGDFSHIPAKELT
jgi:hypothetical protein